MALLHPEILAKIQHYCAYQERCHMEVKNKLYEIGCNTDTVNIMMATLIESGFLNEERFAIAFAGGKFRTKKWGKQKIKRELKLRQITDYCIKKALTSIDESDYAKTLSMLVCKKIDSKSDWKEEQKAISWLMGKGFELDLIKSSIQELRIHNSGFE